MTGDANIVIEDIEQMLGALRFDLGLAGLDDAAYRRRLEADGYAIRAARSGVPRSRAQGVRRSWRCSECSPPRSALSERSDGAHEESAAQDRAGAAIGSRGGLPYGRAIKDLRPV